MMSEIDNIVRMRVESELEKQRTELESRANIEVSQASVADQSMAMSYDEALYREQKSNMAVLVS